MKTKGHTSRLDDALVYRGLVVDRDEALRRILAHEVKVGDEFATSPAHIVHEYDKLEVKREARYVSRGGFKLEAALAASGIEVCGKSCLDIGSSTGGFTDCLLQAGAANVVCVDVNYGDLAWKIRTDERVRVFERTNIKHVDPAVLGAPFDIVVIDVSFIGLARLAPYFPPLMRAGGVFIGLVKPQFESRHDESERGIVTDEAVRARTVAEVEDALISQRFSIEGVVTSPIKGAAGNVEFLVWARYLGQDS